MQTKKDECHKTAIRFWQENGGENYELDVLAQLLRDQRQIERDRCLKVAEGLLESLKKRAKPGDYSEGCLDTAKMLMGRLENLGPVEGE